MTSSIDGGRIANGGVACYAVRAERSVRQRRRRGRHQRHVIGLAAHAALHDTHCHALGGALTEVRKVIVKVIL